MASDLLSIASSGAAGRARRARRHRAEHRQRLDRRLCPALASRSREVAASGGVGRIGDVSLSGVRLAR